MVIKAVIQQQLIFHYVDIIISVEAKQNEPMRPSIFGWGIFTIAVSQWMAQIVPVLFCYSLLLLYLLLLLPTNDTPLRQQLKCIQPRKKMNESLHILHMQLTKCLTISEYYAQISSVKRGTMFRTRTSASGRSRTTMQTQPLLWRYDLIVEICRWYQCR